MMTRRRSDYDNRCTTRWRRHINHSRRLLHVNHARLRLHIDDLRGRLRAGLSRDIHRSRRRARQGRCLHHRNRLNHRLRVNDLSRLIHDRPQQSAGGRTDDGALAPTVVIMAANKSAGDAADHRAIGNGIGPKNLGVRRTDPGCRERESEEECLGFHVTG